MSFCILIYQTLKRNSALLLSIPDQTSVFVLGVMEKGKDF